MTVAFTEVIRKRSVSGNLLRITYDMVATVTYPGSGGYIFQASVLPGALAAFSKIYDVFFPQGQIDLANGYAYEAPVADIDNSDATDPTCEIHAYIPSTGGGDYTEVAGGTTHINTRRIEMVGVPIGGIDGSDI